MFHSHTNGFLAEASGYAMDETGLRIMCGRHGMKTGDSGVVSTIEDMKKWCNAILYGRLLKKESWNECLTLYLERFGFGFRGYGNWIVIMEVCRGLLHTKDFIWKAKQHLC